MAKIQSFAVMNLIKLCLVLVNMKRLKEYQHLEILRASWTRMTPKQRKQHVKRFSKATLDCNMQNTSLEEADKNHHNVRLSIFWLDASISHVYSEMLNGCGKKLKSSYQHQVLSLLLLGITNCNIRWQAYLIRKTSLSHHTMFVLNGVKLVWRLNASAQFTKAHLVFACMQHKT